MIWIVTILVVVAIMATDRVLHVLWEIKYKLGAIEKMMKEAGERTFNVEVTVPRSSTGNDSGWVVSGR